MDSPALWTDHDRLALRSTGALAGMTAELALLQSRLASASDWRPAKPLLAEIAWVQQQFEQMTASWSSKLVVALVGPSGAGKSTLLNALAGREVSRTGLTRPTTQSIIAYAADAADVDALRTRWRASEVQVQTEPTAHGLQHLVLVDAPDTNTTPAGLVALGQVLDTADVVIAVFSAQNPRLHDNIRFLAPYMRHLPADAVVPVINMVDRAPLDELREQVLPDLQETLAAEWGLQAKRIYLVSARASLTEMAFAADEQPLHSVNEFSALRRFLFDALNSATQVVDRRLGRARRLVDLVHEDLDSALDQHRSALERAKEQLERLAQTTSDALRQELEDRAGELRGLDLHAALYGQLSSRWWGPVGWLVAIWGALVRGAAWMTSLGRRGRLLGGADSLEAPLVDTASIEAALARLYAMRWPPVADALSAAGWTGVREQDRWQAEAQAASERLLTQAPVALSAAIDVSVRRLAHPLLQIVLNGPVLALLAWVGYQTVSGFATAQYLSATYFQNAGIALLAVWLAAFVLLQVTVSLAVRLRLRRRASHELAKVASWRLADDLYAQITALLTE